MPNEYGYWVEKDPVTGDYVYKRVEFLKSGDYVTGMIDPYGKLHKFSASVSTTPTSKSFHANACDYFIATAPPENWVWLSPNQLGVRINGRIQPLNHSVPDIFRKRADVADYLLEQNPQAAGRVQRAMNTRTYPTSCGIWKQYEEQTRSLEANKQSYPIGGNVISPLVEAYLTAMNPMVANVYRAMAREAEWEELQVARKLSPERYEYYNQLRRQARELANTRKLSHDWLHATNKQIWEAMVKEAGFTQDELTATSPYASSVVAAVSTISPEMGTLLSEELQRARSQLPTSVSHPITSPPDYDRSPPVGGGRVNQARRQSISQRYGLSLYA